MNVFEAATPTSRPQRVYSTESTSRVICAPIMFVIASVCAPFSRASFIAASVSRVSPDWETPITSVSGPITGFRYCHSLAMSGSTGMRAHSSMT